MRIEFRDEELRRLYTDSTFRVPKLGSDIVKQFRKKVLFLANAEDERDLYNYRALHFEKLVGDRQGQCSVRLNDQWRLILEFARDEVGRFINVVSIEDYH